MFNCKKIYLMHNNCGKKSTFGTSVRQAPIGTFISFPSPLYCRLYYTHYSLLSIISLLVSLHYFCVFFCYLSVIRNDRGLYFSRVKGLSKVLGYQEEGGGGVNSYLAYMQNTEIDRLTERKRLCSVIDRY